MSSGLNSELKMNHSDKRFSIIYCPEYASYFAYDKRKKTSKVLQFSNGVKVKFSEIELLPEPILWDGQLIRYQIIYEDD